MNKFLNWLCAILLGLVLAVALHFSALSMGSSGISLPFGWQGPNHWLTANSPRDRNMGFPFTVAKIDKNRDHWMNETAMALNVVLSIGVGAGTFLAIKKYWLDNSNIRILPSSK